jgi:integrase/recombinase XerD
MPDDLLDLDYLLGCWCRELRTRTSPNTIRIYRGAIQSFLDWCAEQQQPAELTKPTVIAWLDSQAQAGRQPATIRLRLTAIKSFSKWLAAEEGFDADPITAVEPPRLDQRAVPHLTDAELTRLLKACDGTDIRDKRDRAILVLLAETGLRAAELLALDVTDIDLDGCVLLVRRGKGGKGRRVRFSAGAAAAVDRYLRARHRAVLRPSGGPLWVTSRGRLSYTGLVDTLKGRAAAVGVVGFHVHRLRHTAAVRWLRSGGSEVGLMAQAGWASHSMVGRYVKTASEELAAAEFDRLNLGIGDL